MGQSRILVVEDDRAVRRYMQVILERAGYTVEVAADGLEAMKALLAASFDAVITDAIMPHLDGPQLCAFIRRTPSLSATPVILLSGVEQQPQAASTESRADAHLSKPIQPDELTKTLARLLKGQK
jgi:CheY-like chemotaxis protein